MKDTEVITKIEEGDEKAIDFLYTKNYRMIVNMIIKNSGTEEEARDIFQDALIVFWQKVRGKKLVLTSKISTYLYSICRNLWLKELDQKRRLSYEEKDGIQNLTIEEDERKRLVHECISELGETCKKVLTLYYFDGLSMKEIAKEMNFSNADTAKTKKYKCKKALDKLVKEKYSIEDFMD
ncbi:MAG: sigma-70 family RNA polymerase sigma factor [Cytophagales bacterium]|nr:sigma-70 family RNA polymerase sigma factor [Cytophagales bacterium]